MIEQLLAAENLLGLGLLDQAERTFRQALEADPRNGIAAVGLARVALERGDEAGALALARAALEIDPENATARRMVDRLDGVARHRAAAAATSSLEGTAEPVPTAMPTNPTAVAAMPAPDSAEPSIPSTPPAATSASAPASPPSSAPTSIPSSTPPAAAPTITPRPATPTPARPGLLRRLLRRS